jgi:hypothetical protein
VSTTFSAAAFPDGLPNTQLALEFRVYPSLALNRWTPAPIDDAMLYSIENQQGIFQVQLTFDLIDPGVSSTIYLDMPGFSPQMISGFPRCLLGQDPAACERILLPLFAMRMLISCLSRSSSLSF